MQSKRERPASWQQRMVLRLLVFLATAEYESLWQYHVRTGAAIGKAVMKNDEAKKNLETCRDILHRWQKRLHELNTQNGESSHERRS